MFMLPGKTYGISDNSTYFRCTRIGLGNNLDQFGILDGSSLHRCEEGFQIHIPMRAEPH